MRSNIVENLRTHFEPSDQVWRNEISEGAVEFTEETGRTPCH